MSKRGSSDFEYVVTAAALAAVLVIIVSISNLSDDFSARPLLTVTDREVVLDPYQLTQRHARESRLSEVDQRFQQAVMMLHAKRYDMAIKALHRVLELAPVMPEAHSNMGYALLGSGEYKIAYDFFSTAVELRSMFDTAYYGMGLSLEGLNEYEGAIGAMRTYLHLAGDPQFREKAEKYIGEWRKKLADKKHAQAG